MAVRLWTLPFLAESNIGELRIKVTDPAGLAVKATVELSSESIQFQHTYQTDDAGVLNAHNLPFGFYRLHVEHEGFSSYEGLLEIRSALPRGYLIKLSIAAMSTAINVPAAPQDKPLLTRNS